MPSGDHFAGQFVLSREPRPAFDCWPMESLKGWNLSHCPRLPATALQDSRGEEAGWIVGYPISAAGEMLLGGAIRAPAAADSPDFVREAQGLIESLAGRFVAILLAGGASRVYLDPGGMLGAVHHAREPRVASTMGLAAPDPEPDREVIELLDITKTDLFYPFGLTPDRLVKRIAVNHYLDLETLAQVRHWPRPAAEGERQGHPSPAECLRYIADKLKANMAAICEKVPVAIALTAGNDSRMLLAASKEHLGGEFYTARLPDEGAILDCRVAGRLSARYGLRHRVLEWQEPSEAELREWLDRTGSCVAGRTWQAARTFKQFDDGVVTLEGLCGEVGRGFYWRHDDRGAPKLSGEELLARLRMPARPRLIEAADAWADGFAPATVPDQLDRLYIEQRLGCWAGPSLYGHTRKIAISPLSDRAIFAAMKSLPEDYRRRDLMARDVVSLLWGDLARYPFNGNTRTKRALRRSWWILLAIRRRLGLG